MGDHEQNDRDRCNICVYWISNAYCYLNLRPKTCDHYTPLRTDPQGEPTEGGVRVGVAAQRMAAPTRPAW